MDSSYMNSIPNATIKQEPLEMGAMSVENDNRDAIRYFLGPLLTNTSSYELQRKLNVSVKQEIVDEIIQVKLENIDASSENNVQSETGISCETLIPVSRTDPFPCRNVDAIKTEGGSDSLNQKTQNPTVVSSPDRTRTDKNTALRRFVCKVCQMAFANEGSWRAHFRIHVQEKCHSCSVCKKQFQQEACLLRHRCCNVLQRHTCDVCDAQFKLESSLTRHYTVHGKNTQLASSRSSSQKKNYVACDDIKREESHSYTGVQEQYSDAHSIQKEKSYSCSVCNKSFMHKKSLHSHSFVHAKNSYTVSSTSTTQEKSSDAQSIQKENSHSFSAYSRPVITRKRSLNSNSVVRSKNSCSVSRTSPMQEKNSDTHSLKKDSLSCLACSKNFTSKRNLDSHSCVRTKNSSSVSSTSPLQKKNSATRNNRKAKSHSCLTCNKSFTRKSNYNLHSCVRPKKQYSCSTCQKCFVKKSYLHVHRQTHSSEKSHVCVTCGKGFTLKSYLNTHCLSHKAKSFTCGVCSKSFTQKSSLNLHSSVHSGVKPYICGVCDKRFLLKSYLDTHSVTHTGEKKHRCATCKKCFTQRSSLNFHLKSHSK